MAEKALASLSISSLPPSMNLPPLPPIQDSIIERKVYTHSSFIAKPKYSNQLFDLEDEGRDNEKLELLGDSLLDCAVVGLLQDLYPNLNPGIATLLKSHLVNNSTLRELCKCYHLNERLIAPPEQLPLLRNGEKVLANLFEAYIAGVYYSYLKHGSRSGSGSSASNVIPTPPRSPSSNSPPPSSSATHTYLNGSSSSSTSPNRSPTRGEAMDYLETWLRPLFQPIAEHILIQMKEEQQQRNSILTNDDIDTDRNAIGANSHLNQWFIAKEGGMPDYACSSEGLKGWKVLCRAVDRDGKSWFGEATRATKKAAMAVAAYKVKIQFIKERPEFNA